MKQRILITGGSGMIGTALTRLLLIEGYEVIWLSRSGRGMPNVTGFKWNIETQTADNEAFNNLYGIIHLAGEGIANKRWTAIQRKKIIESRVKSAQLLANKIEERKTSVQVLISASGAGYYGYDNGDIELEENAPSGNDFVADVVKKWEAAADQFQKMGIRVVKFRIGIVLSDKGGALEKIALPIKWMIGAPLGNGRQYISWIHVNDLCQLFLFTLKNNNINGTYNAATKNAVTNTDLTKAIATILNKPLFLPNIPVFLLKLMLGEMSNLLLGSSKLSSKKINIAGFKFKNTDIKDALEKLLKSK